MQAHKASLCTLGVDTDLFHPAEDEAARQARAQLRETLGFAPSDIICIYTGRFSKDKNPLCLAQAIDVLTKQGESFRGLFVGNGPPAEVAAIRTCAGCTIHPFVPVRELPPLYRAADIGVWPQQESTSMLDAAAAGLPIVISDRVKALERVQGNGLTYHEGDPQDLARALQRLRDEDMRRQLGRAGAAKIAAEYSWLAIARRRVADYEAALNGIAPSEER